MDSRFDNKIVVKRFHKNLFATSPREYSAGIIATFAVTLCLAFVRILSSVGAWDAPFFDTMWGELVVSFVWPITGGFLVPVFVYFMLTKKGKMKEKFSRDTFKQNFHNFGYRKITKEIVLLSIAFGILYSVANQGIATITQNIMIMLGLNIGGGASEYGNFMHLIIMVFTSAILPAICEETVDRGILTYSLKKRGDWTAILVSAAIFAFTHMYIAQTFYTFALGVIVGYVVVKTGNIIPGIIVHFINNFGGTVFHYLYVKDLPGKQGYELIIKLSEENPFLLILIWVAALIASIFLARFIVKFNNQQKKLKEAIRARERFEELKNTEANPEAVLAAEVTGDDGFIENSFEHYQPYKPKFREDIFLYAMLILNVGATIFSLLWAL